MNKNIVVMKPKISSGYLTPQGNKRKKVMDNLSGNKKTNKAFEIDDEVFKTLMQCPEKKKMILKLLALNKNAIEEYKQKETEDLDSVKKLKKPINCESPTALFRRKALEQMNSPQSLSQASLKESAVESSNPVPYNQIFEGVTAFVEIISNGEDRSEGVKSVLKLMGAKVKDRISSDVTHVIFKGGSFTTFNKARIIKAHVVSVLWVEASRQALQKQDERLYHAIKSTQYNHDSTFICKKMEKEYEDLIKKEYKRSIVEGTPLPPTDTLINRRRTFMVSARSCSVTNNSSDRNILSPERNSENGQNVCLNSSDMELTMIDCVKSSDINKDFMNSSIKIDNIQRRAYNKRKTICSVSTDTDKTPSDISAHTTSLQLNPPRNSIDESIIFGKNAVITKILSNGTDLSDKMSNIQVSTEDVMSQLAISPENALNKVQIRSSTQTSRRKSTAVKARKSLYLSKDDTGSLSTLSDMEVSSKRSRRKSNLPMKNFPNIGSSSKMSTLQVSTENTKSSMSSLRVSSEHSSGKKEISKSTKSSMSSLRVSSEHSSDKKEINISTISSMSPLAIHSAELLPNDKIDSFASSEKNSCELAEFVDDVVASLKTPNKEIMENDVNYKSSDSEILSPRGCSRKLFPVKEQSKKENQHTSLSSGSSCESAVKTVRRKRKLYDPDDPIMFKVNDEEEREQRREAIIMKLNRSKEKSSDIDKSIGEDDASSAKNSSNNSSSKRSLLRQGNEVDTSSSDEDCKVVKTRRVRKTKRKVNCNVDFDSSADEQRDLMLEIMGSKPTKIISQSSPKSQFSKPTDSVTPYRRSTMDFQPPSQINSTKRMRRTDLIKLPTIVCTKLHSDEVKFFTEAVERLGRFTVENVVSNNTTHLVAGESKRTLNMLRAVSRGCWVVNFDWVLKSLEKGRWLPEEDFEVMDFAPIVQKSRLQRQAFGSKYSMDVFESCGPIFVGFNTNPKCSDLKELVVLCKGKLVNTKRRARVVIGEASSEEGVVCVNEIWLLDCIKKNRLLRFKDYLLSTKKRESIVV